MTFCFLSRKTAAVAVLMLRQYIKEEDLHNARFYEFCSSFKHNEIPLEEHP